MRSKLTRVMACLLFLAVIFNLPLPARAEEYPYIAHATDSVRLRSGPSSSSVVLAIITQGDAVLVTGAADSYKLVEYEGNKGYVMASFLDGGSLAAENAIISDSKYRLLAIGSSGAEVKALQEALSELGYYSITVDSKYGSKTEQAVRSFQEKNELGVSGTADQTTQALLFEGQPVNTAGQKVDVKTLPPIPGYTMRSGDRGDAVFSLQERLVTLKYFDGKPDGVYGAGTENAVRQFQKANGLADDGIAGEKTQAALASAIIPSPSLQPSPVPTDETSVFVPAPEGEAVYPYQTTASESVNLRKRASISSMRLITVPKGAAVEVLEDSGDYLKAVYRGYTGYVMKDYINIPEQYLSGKTLEMDTDARVKYETLTSGAEGKKVRALQQALKELGFYNGTIDGKFGAGTLAALKAFQKKNGLRETGIALPELQQLLYEKRVRNSKNSLVTLKTLPPVDGLTLTEGDYGDAVYELHQLLAQSKLFTGEIGYEYTRATTAAVRSFQKAHSIKETGKADSFTLLALRAAVAAPTPGTGVTPSPAPITEDNVVIIRSGARGQAVSRLQARLVELGYYSITPDGEYNSDDIAAVRQFQRVNGLTANGVADLATQQTLYASYALRADAQASQVTPSPKPGASLKIGSSGSEVKALQSRLITLKYLTGTADGIFGTQTAAAVSSFQQTNGLVNDGIAGSQTLGVLYSASAKAYSAPKATSTPKASPTPEVFQIGDTGSGVVAIQLRLIALKYLSGSADGIFGPGTFNAVKAFQEKNRLEADGIAGKLTVATLNSPSAIAYSGLIAPVTPSPSPQPPSGPSFSAPKASEVRFANWFVEIRPIAQRLRDVVIYDFISGKHYNFRLFSLGKHADGTTLTKEDTAVMNSVLGENNWTPRPVWVIFSDGRVYMASTHSHGHEVDYISSNGITGHLCIHFPREMEEAALTGPYAVSHQNAILAGWDLTQNMAR